MSDETMKKEPSEENKTGGLGDILSGIGKGLVDGLAATTPIAGKMLQYGVNAAGIETPDYADRSLRRSKAKQDLIAAQQRNEDWKANAGLREKQRQMEGMKIDEYIAGAPRREAERNAATVKANLSQAMLDEQYKKFNMSRIQDKVKKDVFNSGFPGTYSELNDIFSSPQMRLFTEGQHYKDELKAIANRDESAFGRMDRALRYHGFDLIDGVGGVKELYMGNLGKIAVTKENMDAFEKQLTSKVAEEVRTRSELTNAATMGNPYKRANAKWTKALMPYNSNDATHSKRIIDGIYNEASDEERGWNTLNQAFSDYYNPGLPTKARVDGVLAAMELLPKAGYAIENFDPQNPNLDAAIVKDVAKGTSMSFGNFAMLCRDNDTLSKKLEERVGMAQWSYAMQNGRKTSANGAGSTQPKKDAGKKGKEGTEETGGADRSGEEITRHIEYGKRIVKNFGIEKDVGEIWNAVSSGKKNKIIQSRNDLNRVIAEAYDTAADTYAKTENYGKAQDHWRQRLKAAGVPENLIPDVWTGHHLESQKKRLETNLSKQMREDTKGRENNPHYRTRYLNGRTGKPRGLYSNNMGGTVSPEEFSRKKREETATELNRVDELIERRSKARQAQEPAEQKSRRERFWNGGRK